MCEYVSDSNLFNKKTTNAQEIIKIIKKCLIDIKHIFESVNLSKYHYF